MIKDFIDQEGPVQINLLVKSVVRGISTSGSPYLAITLQDKSGTIEARKWQIDENDEQLAVPGQVLLIDGVISTYKGHPQIRIDDMEPVDQKNISYEKLIPSSPTPIVEMKKKVKDYLELVKDDDLKKLTTKLIFDHEEDYFTFPAAVSVHHAFLGGLAYHSLNICNDAIKMAENYPLLNRDYLICGSLLHDIGKLLELSGYIATNYTLAGNLLGHLDIGSIILYNEGKKLNIDEEKLLTLSHIIVSHHGKPEFGAIKTPLTPEAYIIHSLDDIDAKMEILSQAFEQTLPGEFTKKIPWMDNLAFYKDKSKE